MIRKLIPLVAIFLSGSAMAQVGIGTKKAANSSQLDIVASDKGVLLPRVELKAIDDYSPIVGEMIESLLIYNTGSAKVTAGFYYWKDYSWIPLRSGDSLVDRKNNTFTIGANPARNDEESLIITDTESHSVYLAVAEIANNDVFVTNLVENQDFITQLGDNVEFINQITNNNEFIENIINELKTTYGNVGYDVTTNQFFYYDEQGNVVTISWESLGNTKIRSFEVDETNDVLVITDTEDTRFTVSIDDLGKIIANNDVFVTNLVENQDFITQLGDNVEFINQITNNNEFIENIINELKTTYGNVGYDVTTNQFFYYDEQGNVVTISWESLGNTKIRSFEVDETNDVLVITDTEDTRFTVSIDDLGKIIANNDVFVTNLVENQDFITQLGDNVEFINQITNNNEFIENIINELKTTYGNVGYDVTTNQFFYYDEQGNVVTISWESLGNTKIRSFEVDETNDVLVITDTEDTRFTVSIDDLGKIIANNDVFVTNLVENQDFITQLGDNVDFINQITNNNEFIENIINELKTTYGNVGYDVTTNQFFYYDEQGNVVTISWESLGNTKIKSFEVDETNDVLVITDTEDTRFTVSIDDLGKIIANNDVFVTNLVENQDFITQLGDNVDFINQITNNNEFIENIINELKTTYGNVGYDVTTNQFFYYDEQGNVVTISWESLGNTKIKSFEVDETNDVLVITDTEDTRFTVSIDDLGKIIANNDIFVTNLVENQDFITQLGDNVDFINQITNNNEFIENIINELKTTYGNVGYDVTTNQFFYYDEQGNVVTISWESLSDTKIKSFEVDETNDVLVITDTADTRFTVSIDDLGKIIANNDVFVTNLVENQDFITQLGDNVDFINQITNNNEFIENIINELKTTYGNVGYDVTTNQFFYYDEQGNIVTISWESLSDTKIKSFEVDETNDVLVITDTADTRFTVSIDDLGKIIANNDVFVTNLVENQDFITQLGDNVEFINQITNNNEFIENIINELKTTYGNVGYDVTTNQFFYYDEQGNVVTISWESLGNTKIKSFEVDETNDVLVITDTEDTRFTVSIDDLGKIIANNDVFVTNLVENQEFITKLGDNVDFINQITNNNEFIENIINELKTTYGNVGYDVTTNQFFYYDEQGNIVTINLESLSDTKIKSFEVDETNDVLVITDTADTRFTVSIDDLGKIIANNDVFVTNLVENQEFITKLGDNVDFINQITNNNEFIENIINELKTTYGNVGYDVTTNQFFYYDEQGNIVTINLESLSDTKIKSFEVDETNDVLVITDTADTRFTVSIDDLGKIIANNDVFVTNLVENQEFITKLGDNVDFINQITNNNEFIENIINELKTTYGNVGYDVTTNQFFYYDEQGNIVTINLESLSDTKIKSFEVDETNDVLVITDTADTRFTVSIDDLGKIIANNDVFVTNLVENQEFITKLGDNVEFINQITNEVKDKGESLVTDGVIGIITNGILGTEAEKAVLKSVLLTLKDESVTSTHIKDGTIKPIDMAEGEANQILVTGSDKKPTWKNQNKVTPNFFYMPAVIFDTSVTGIAARDLYAEYVNQFTGGSTTSTSPVAYPISNGPAGTTPIIYGGGIIGSVGAPADISIFERGELYYYITYYDEAAFENLSISADGRLTYRVKAGATASSYMNIVFVIK